MSKNKLGRNDKCWCGSDKKFKACHFPQQQQVQQQNKPFANPLLDAMMMEPEKDMALTLQKIMKGKENGNRKLPSSNLITNGEFLPLKLREYLLDECAKFADENWVGRNEMCIQFCVILKFMIKYYAEIDVNVMEGKVKYIGPNNREFTWDHVWIETKDGYIIDGNADSMIENPMVPEEVNPSGYWGLIDELPKDREIISKFIMSEQNEKELKDDMDEVGKWMIIVKGKSKSELLLELGLID